MPIVDFFENFLSGFKEHAFSQQGEFWTRLRDLGVGFSLRGNALFLSRVWTFAGFLRGGLFRRAVVGQCSTVILNGE